MEILHKKAQKLPILRSCRDLICTTVMCALLLNMGGDNFPPEEVSSDIKTEIEKTPEQLKIKELKSEISEILLQNRIDGTHNTGITKISTYKEIIDSLELSLSAE